MSGNASMPTSHNRTRGASRELIEAARQLRVGQTPAERILWEALRGRKLDGFKFRRQYPVGRHILDFACVEQKLVIELDGKHHESDAQYTYDQERTEHLEGYGYRIVRFGNEAVFADLPGVLDRIRAELQHGAQRSRAGMPN